MSSHFERDLDVPLGDAARPFDDSGDDDGDFSGSEMDSEPRS